MCERWLVSILLGVMFHPNGGVLALRKRCVVKCELYVCLDQIERSHHSMVQSIFWP